MQTFACVRARVPHLEAVQDVPPPVTHRTEHVEHRPVGDLAGQTEVAGDLGDASAPQEHGRGVAAAVGGQHLSDLDRVVGEEVVEHHDALVSVHRVRVVPPAVEAQHVAVVVKELLQRVTPLVRAQRLHALQHLAGKQQQSVWQGATTEHLAGKQQQSIWQGGNNRASGREATPEHLSGRQRQSIWHGSNNRTSGKEATIERLAGRQQ